MKDKITSAFGEVRAEQELKTQTKIFLSEYYRKKESKKPFAYSKYALAAAAVAVVLISCVSLFSYSVPVSAISLDSEASSVEIKINSFNRVVDVACFGESSVTDLDLKNKSYEEAVSAILEINKSNSDSAETVITVNCENEKKGKQIADSIKSCHGSALSIECHSSEISREAHLLGLSTGKYLVYLELKNAGIEISPEKAKELSMKELRNMLGNTPCTENNEAVQDPCNEAPSSHNGQGKHHYASQHGKHN